MKKKVISLREFSRRGGQANTAAQKLARAANGKKGGRKRKLPIFKDALNIPEETK